MTEICAIDDVADSGAALSDIAAQFGGKAAGLVRLRRAGVPTPPTWFVTHTVPADTFDTTRLDPMVQRWAVRSSATVEDGGQRSYAGLFSSELAVDSSAVPAALHRVRASGANARVHAVHDGAVLGPIPVVLQPYFEAQAAGVWIGDGVGGGILEWSSSGNDAVVAGRVTPTREIWRQGKLVDGDRLMAEGQAVAARCLAIEEAVIGASDIEFCVAQGRVVWLQCRPATARIPGDIAPSLPTHDAGIVAGIPASGGIHTGRPRVMDSPEDADWKPGDILVVRFTSIDWVPIMAEASAVVTDIGGALSHAAIIARELGIPCVTGTSTGTTLLRSLDAVTVDGDAGQVRLNT
ncbi:MAG: hypothetical protein JWN03_5202 [Nocardia sp.]|uniref:PEP-utilizing enzyme n=1 Tax=Nocardia sp. TaxID=1821 RepID=UPI002629CCC6|nr:PEP-utilizing enzyme [Nocardia sp.]MCU1644927.1 hypothetical protein [Nocardia sp.]